MIRTSLVIAACAAMTLLAACGASSEEPRTLEAATAAAQEKTDRFASGDFAGEWELFSKQVRDRITRDEYVRYARACKSTGSKIDVVGVRMEGDHATVRLEVGDQTESRTMAYEDGQWRQAPSGTWHEQPIDKLIADCSETQSPTSVQPETPPVNDLPTKIVVDDDMAKFMDRAESQLEPCFNSALRCDGPISQTVGTLRQLLRALPSSAVNTQAATQNTIATLERHRGVCQDVPTNEKVERDCPVLIIKGLLLDISFARAQDLNESGSG